MTRIVPDQREFDIKVPASIANLGPGFDTLAVAVQLYVYVKATVIPGHGQMEFQFIDHDLCGENHIERAYRFLAGAKIGSMPSLSVRVRSDIPMGAGLGSSAAATVAGFRLYDAVAGPISKQAILDGACALEGHPDNASAALLGGLTASCQLSSGSVRAVNFSWPSSLRFIVATPEGALGTKRSRAALPRCVPIDDAVYNVQRVALLLHSLQVRDFSLLRQAISDRLHQPARQEIVAGLKEALELQHPDLLGICLSGSGPSIVAIAEQNLPTVGGLLASIFERIGIGYCIRTLQVHEAQVDLAHRNLFSEDRLQEDCGVMRVAYYAQ